MHDKKYKGNKIYYYCSISLADNFHQRYELLLHMDGCIDTDERRENNIVLTFRCLIVNHFTACAFIVMTLCHFHKWCYILHMVMLNHQI